MWARCWPSRSRDSGASPTSRTGGALHYTVRSRRMSLLLHALLVLFAIASPRPSTNTSPRSDTSAVARDGQRDFDFEIGSWTIRMKRLAHPLSGSSEWISPEGYSHIVRKVWNGQASLAELENDRPSATLRRTDAAHVQSAVARVEHLLGEQQIPARSTHHSSGTSRTGAASSSSTTRFKESRYSCASSTPTSRPHRSTPSRPTRPMTARRGRRTSARPSRANSRSASEEAPPPCVALPPAAPWRSAMRSRVG